MPKDLPSTPPETNKPGNESSSEDVSSEGIQAIRGKDIHQGETSPNKKEPLSEEHAQFPALDDPITKEWERMHNPANYEYKLGSPHKDYQAYKDLNKAKRQHEIGENAATADSLPDAIDTTLNAKKESDNVEESKFDEYFYRKYGRTPFTSDAYPKNGEENKEPE